MKMAIYGLDFSKMYDISKVSESDYIKIKKQVRKDISKFYKKNLEIQIYILDQYRKHMSSEQWIIFYNSITMPNDIFCKNCIKQGEINKLEKMYKSNVIQIGFKKAEYENFDINRYVEEGKIDMDCFSYELNEDELLSNNLLMTEINSLSTTTEKNKKCV